MCPAVRRFWAFHCGRLASAGVGGARGRARSESTGQPCHAAIVTGIGRMPAGCVSARMRLACAFQGGIRAALFHAGPIRFSERRLLGAALARWLPSKHPQTTPRIERVTFMLPATRRFMNCRVSAVFCAEWYCLPGLLLGFVGRGFRAPSAVASARLPRGTPRKPLGFPRLAGPPAPAK